MDNYDPDTSQAAIEVLRLTVTDGEFKAPIHSHKKGQLVMPVTGSMLCEVDNEILMVPTESAVWIPAGLPHRNRPASSASFCFAFINSSKVALPNKCCTLTITPLVREMILYLAESSAKPPALEQTNKITEVLFDMLAQMPREQLNFPLSSDAKLRKVANILLENPSDRRTIKQWAAYLAMSDRTFSRLVVKETGMTFGLWRKQLHIVVSLQQLSQGISVQSVSEHLGYDSVSAFITMFKKALGKSPKRYITKQ